ncbi:MAG: hypothetical protein NVSMB42_10380 [Herpetosiphon sp.]
MAEIRLLTPEQLAERDKKPKGKSGRRRSEERTRIIEHYKEILRHADVGAGGDVMLEASEDKRVVRQNLKTAAIELEKVIEFRPIKDRSRIHFRIITPQEQATKPRRPGRPRKRPLE